MGDLVIRKTRKGGLKVLTIDGEADIRVGVVSCLLVLLDMMRRAARDCPEMSFGDGRTDSQIPEALPYKCFDLIVGSGDGGWIAIMLGRLHMSTSQVIATYLQIRSSIHNKYPHRGTASQWNRGLQAAFFDDLVKLSIVNNTVSQNSEEMLLTRDPACYVAALAMHKEGDAPHAALFRNYLGRTSNLPNCSIRFAIKAATASSLFPPAESGGRRFLAASELGFNNPVDEAISEALERARYLNIPGPPIAYLVSLGAGHPGVKPIDESDRAKTTLRLARDALKSHNKASRLFAEAEHLREAKYFRLNVEQGFQKDLLQGINEGVIHTHTEMYLRKVEVDQSMENVVKLLAAAVTPQIVGPRSSKRTTGTAIEERSSSLTSGRYAAFRIQPSIPKSELIRTYTKELYTLDLGLPLWDPEPVRKVVEIGDLGFVNKNGSFETLFNITVRAKDQPGYDLPPGFKPFRVPRKTVNVKKRALRDWYLHSGRMEFKLEEAPQHWNLRLKIDYGAILILNDSPTHCFIHPSALLVKYIQTHYKEWYAFMETLLTCPKQILDCSGLLLVTGMHRNNAWSLGAWKKTGGGHHISHKTPKPGQSHIIDMCGWQPAGAPGVREGPSSQEALPQLIRQHGVGTQTLFIEGYRIRRRGHLESLLSQDGQDETISPPRSWWGKVKDASRFGGQGHGEQILDPPGYPSRPLPSATQLADGANDLFQEISLTPIHSGRFPRHPLDDLADEIFELLPNAQTVIVHDQDMLKVKHLVEKDMKLPSHFEEILEQSAECAFFPNSSLDQALVNIEETIQTTRMTLVKSESLLTTSDLSIPTDGAIPEDEKMNVENAFVPVRPDNRIRLGVPRGLNVTNKTLVGAPLVADSSGWPRLVEPKEPSAYRSIQSPAIVRASSQYKSQLPPHIDHPQEPPNPFFQEKSTHLSRVNSINPHRRSRSHSRSRLEQPQPHLDSSVAPVPAAPLVPESKRKILPMPSVIPPGWPDGTGWVRDRNGRPYLETPEQYRVRYNIQTPAVPFPGQGHQEHVSFQPLPLPHAVPQPQSTSVQRPYPAITPPPTIVSPFPQKPFLKRLFGGIVGGSKTPKTHGAVQLPLVNPSTPSQPLLRTKRRPRTKSF